MIRVLVTGGTGNLGWHAVAALDARGVVPRILSRRPPPQDMTAHREWATADLVRGDLGAAVRDVDIVLHLASEKGRGDADVVATARLLDAARAAHVRHFVVVSIVGCDRIPLPFYSSKVAIEAAVRAGGVPWTAVRVTQFHSFVERLVSAAATLPIPAPLFADLRFQPVDEGEAAKRLVEIALGPPLGDAPEIGGPQNLSLGEIAAIWLSVHERASTLVPIAASVPVEGAPPAAPWVPDVLDGYRRGWNIPSARATLGRIGFEDWLRAKASAKPS